MENGDERAMQRVQRMCSDAGVQLAGEQWRALPAAARRRLLAMPMQSDSERQRLVAVARWMIETFPPGWNRVAESR